MHVGLKQPIASATLRSTGPGSLAVPAITADDAYAVSEQRRHQRASPVQGYDAQTLIDAARIAQAAAVRAASCYLAAIGPNADERRLA